MLDYDAFRREQAEARAAGRYLGVGTCTYVEPTTTGFGRTTAPRAPRSASSRRARSTCTSPAARPATASRPPSSSSPPTRSASTSPTSRTIQGDTAVTPFGAGTGGSRSGSMIAGAVAETAADPPRAARRHRRPPARGRARRHRARRRPGAACGARRRSALSLGRDRRRSPTSSPHELPPGVAAGLEASARYTRRRPFIWANATHVCTCEVDVVTGHVDAAALHRERGLRPDDQPQRRRGPDRRRRRCRASAACSTSTSPTTTTATRSRRRSWTTCCRPSTEVPTIEYGHVETPGARARRLQGRRRGRRDRRAARGRERRRRRARALRRDDHPAAAEPRRPSSTLVQGAERR